MNKLSHTDEHGKAHMVDISGKPQQVRRAVASGSIRLSEATIRLISENQIKKGDVLTVAEIAGIQAGKRTSDLIPLCHPLPLSQITVKAILNPNGVEVTAVARCTAQTGVEMEALTAVSVALLTVYDMCKAVDKEMVMENVRLIEKTKT